MYKALNTNEVDKNLDIPVQAKSPMNFLLEIQI